MFWTVQLDEECLPLEQRHSGQVRSTKTALLDAFVFNAIQFWSGSNPVTLTKGPDGFPKEIRGGDATIELSWLVERRSARLTYRHNADVLKRSHCGGRSGVSDVR
jgi:hypothetical protein